MAAPSTTLTLTTGDTVEIRDDALDVVRAINGATKRVIDLPGADGDAVRVVVAHVVSID